MPDVFTDVLARARPQLHAAALASWRELGLDRLVGGRLDALAAEDHRVHALLGVLLLEGSLARDGDRLVRGPVEIAPAVLPGWTPALRTGRPLPAPDERAFHAHLAAVGAEPARALFAELALELPGDAALLDAGGGAGVYARAFRERFPGGRTTVVDRADLPGVDVRAELFELDLGPRFDVALAANLLHLYDEDQARALVEILQRHLVPGGLLIVKDLDPETPEGVHFALTMALYTDGGRVHPPEKIEAWTGGVARRTGTSIVVTARRP